MTFHEFRQLETTVVTDITFPPFSVDKILFFSFFVGSWHYTILNSLLRQSNNKQDELANIKRDKMSILYKA
jgi:hypothetical protein